MDANQEIQRAKVNQNSWKLALTRHIVNLEDNLAQLYNIAGIKYIRVVVEADTNEEVPLLEGPKGLDKHEISTYEKVITEHVNDINRSVSTICNLISSDAEFDLPIPVVILLRLASKVSQLRWLDFRQKIPGTLAKKHIFNKTSLSLIQTSLTMFRWISSTLATDILPFQGFINEHNFNLLEWTRTSHLERHASQQYHWIRSLVFAGITWELAQFSLNVNYNAEQLKTLIGTELVEELSRVQQQADDYPAEKYVYDALDCLDWLFITYSKWLDAQLEFKVKSFILHTCLDIYRNFEKNPFSLNCRRQLLRVLVTVANQPFATSTTELAWHIIELASRLESDLEIVLLTRKAIDLGLAHRPSVILGREFHATNLSLMEAAAELNVGSGAELIVEPVTGPASEIAPESVSKQVEEPVKVLANDLCEDTVEDQSIKKSAKEPLQQPLEEPPKESENGPMREPLSVTHEKPPVKTVKESPERLAKQPLIESEPIPVCPEVEKISYLFVDELAQ